MKRYRTNRDKKMKEIKKAILAKTVLTSEDAIEREVAAAEFEKIEYNI